MSGYAPDSQRQLWLVPQPGQAAQGLVADVAVKVRSPRPYSYAVPPELESRVQPGARVRVPYGRSGRPVDGVCVRVGTQAWDHTLKPIAEVLSPDPLVTPALIELGLWISDYYVCPPGLTLAALVPASRARPRGRRILALRSTGPAPDRELTPKQQALLAALAGGPLPRLEALAAAGAGTSVAAALAKLGLIETVYLEPPPAATPARAAEALAATERPPRCPEDDFALSAGQQAALADIAAALDQSDTFGVLLLFGVPGSGKTEVYVRAIRQAIAGGRQAILLVPEIALATQIVQRLARRFERVAIFHGRLSARQRRQTLDQIAAGAVDVVIGTRSAVFAPCPQLGLIVVDEEQDGSYKNLAAPYYHARDVAIKRAQTERIVCVLGSATPALETWHNAQTLRHFGLLRLPERVAGAALPHVRLVDTRRPELGQTTTVLSPELHHHLVETLAARQQAILLHNRRGYAAHLRCIRCGLTVTCDRCGARLVYHQPDASVHCHRCGVRSPAPTQCPDATCGGELQRLGLAIQRLEEELRRVVPQARLLRLDRDTMRRREDYAAALDRFERGQADILLGTQMVAKGLDFPRVRLVGVIEADFALSLPDFRAAEQVFQLVLQVVGRAGRREGAALAIVQTADVAAPAIQHAIRMDFEAFAEQELSGRRRFFYPPYARLARLVLADARPGRARREAEACADRLRALAAGVHPGLRVDDAGPCAIPRLRQMLRHEIILRAPRDGSLQRLLHEALARKQFSPRVQRFTIDVDAVDLM